METKKTTSAWRRLYDLAYAQSKSTSQKHQQEPLPGWKFDATVIGLFLVLGVAYFT